MFVTAAAAVTLLTHYLDKAADKAAERIGEKAVEAVGTLYTYLRGKLARDAEGSSILTDFEKQPSDPDRQASLEQQITRLIERDSEFSAHLTNLVTNAEALGAASIVFSVNQSGDSNKTIINTGSGNQVKA